MKIIHYVGKLSGLAQDRSFPDHVPPQIFANLPPEGGVPPADRFGIVSLVHSATLKRLNAKWLPQKEHMGLKLS